MVVGCAPVGVRLEEECVSELTPLEFVEVVGSGGLLLQSRSCLFGAVNVGCGMKCVRLREDTYR